MADINEYAPAFLEPSYVRQVDEGRLYEEVVRVEASDRDCTPKFGDVCKYEILTSDQPFTIDSEGVIRNTEPLDYERSHNHILTVVAYDCGMKQSVPVMVTIKVNRVCKLGWKGELNFVVLWLVDITNFFFKFAKYNKNKQNIIIKLAVFKIYFLIILVKNTYNVKNILGCQIWNFFSFCFVFFLCTYHYV